MTDGSGLLARSRLKSIVVLSPDVAFVSAPVIPCMSGLRTRGTIGKRIAASTVVPVR